MYVRPIVATTNGIPELTWEVLFCLPFPRSGQPRQVPVAPRPRSWPRRALRAVADRLLNVVCAMLP